MQPMFEEDAIAQMEELGHAFFVFLNAETDQVACSIGAPDGTYGLIEPVIEQREDRAEPRLRGQRQRGQRPAAPPRSRSARRRRRAARSLRRSGRRTRPRRTRLMGSSAMARTLARPEPRRRLTWPAGAPPVGIHLGVGNGLLRAARRSRQIGARALQIFSDNPTAWRRRPEPPPEAPEFVAYCAREGIDTIAIHASYLINLAGSAEPFASQSRAGLISRCSARPPTARRWSTRTSARTAAWAPRPGSGGSSRTCGRSWRSRPPASGWCSRTRRVAATCSARGSRSWRRSWSGGRGAAGPARLLPGHRPPVGRRLRHLRRPRERAPWSIGSRS